MSDIAKILANNLRRLREERSLRQEDLAEISKLSVSTIRGYEGMRRWPELPYLEALAKAFKVPQAELFKTSSDDQDSPGSIDGILELLTLWKNAHPSDRDAIMSILRRSSAQSLPKQKRG